MHACYVLTYLRCTASIPNDTPVGGLTSKDSFKWYTKPITTDLKLLPILVPGWSTLSIGCHSSSYFTIVKYKLKWSLLIIATPHLPWQTVEIFWSVRQPAYYRYSLVLYCLAVVSILDH